MRMFAAYDRRSRHITRFIIHFMVKSNWS